MVRRKKIIAFRAEVNEAEKTAADAREFASALFL
jgi:hypothetical protein